MKLENKLKQIAQLMGEPIKFHIGIWKGKIQIWEVDKLLSEEEGDSSPEVDIQKKVKIDEPLTYIC